jgi:subtilisin family serine protease
LIIFIHTQFVFSETHKVWVFLKDKKPSIALQKSPININEASLKRRAKVRPPQSLLTSGDMAVSSTYIYRLTQNSQKVRTVSRWLNAVSIEANDIQLRAIRSFEFVEKIVKVKAYKKPQAIYKETISPAKLSKPSSGSLDYGNSAVQLEQIKVPELHALGYYGQGVIIAMLDNGFNRYDTHVALDHLNILEVYDFTTGDSSAGSGSHGTNTLSVIGAYEPGELIGPAYKASYLLAKTEVNSSETAIEEDYWVAGLEWAEARGADIVSSSLGYIDWYDYQDMDGQTAVTTIAADSAVERGVLIITSAGNEYNSSWRYIIAPADGDNVLAIAAVTANGFKSSFSSVGPTADGRIKPDLAAMGSFVRMASTSNDRAFTNANGTSFSCPLAAGAAAQLLSAFPTLTPFDVHKALRSTASQSSAPDTALGWGIINIKNAYYAIDTTNLDPVGPVVADQLVLYYNYPNPFNLSTTIKFQLKKPAEISVQIFNIAGQHITTMLPRKFNPSAMHTIDVSLPQNSASGIYFYKIIATDLITGKEYRQNGKMTYLK